MIHPFWGRYRDKPMAHPLLYSTRHLGECLNNFVRSTLPDQLRYETSAAPNRERGGIPRFAIPLRQHLPGVEEASL